MRDDKFHKYMSESYMYGTFCEYTFYRVYTCITKCKACVLLLRDVGGGVQLVYAGHLLLAWGNIFDGRRGRVGVCVLYLFCFDGSWSVCACVCVYTRTYRYTLHVGYCWMRVEGSGRDTSGRRVQKIPDELNLRMRISVFVYGVHM